MSVIWDDSPVRRSDPHEEMYAKIRRMFQRDMARIYPVPRSAPPAQAPGTSPEAVNQRKEQGV
jgi:hypothetical protein